MEYELKSDRGYSLLFHSQERDTDGWLSFYSVTITAPNFKGTIQVDNSPYGITPAELFVEIAKDWKGFNGEKSWGSLEGEFDIEAKSDSTGHIIITASINTGFFPPCSKMVSEFEIEAGQLESISNQMNEFFK